MSERAPRHDRSMKTHERVAEELRGRIARGELAVNERLPPEDELMGVFDVARGTLREALRVLESQGLITIRRGRGGGPIVTRPDLAPAATVVAVGLQLERATVGDLDEVRHMIEPAAAARLARRHTKADIAALDEAIDAAHTAAEADDNASFGVAAARIHETLVERTGNPALGMVSQLLQELNRWYYADRAAPSTKRGMRQAVRSYRRLLELIRAGDAEAAAEHWQARLLNTSRGHRSRQLDLF